jgi:putative restriction endonuclease
MDQTQAAILQRIRDLSVWTKAGERAPHKPLLLLFALARVAQNAPRLITFNELEIPLRSLIINYGPPRASIHPEYPFWWLQSDGLWQVLQGTDLRRRRGGTAPLKSELVSKEVQAGLPEPIYQQFHKHPALLEKAVREILDRNFPTSLHEDILNEVGLAISLTRLSKRDSAFRRNVIRAYAHSCAVCGFDLKIGAADFALDAAHIKWHQIGGPDEVPNGLALCTIHHKALDRGVIGISKEATVLLSVDLHGATCSVEWFENFNGKPLKKPTRAEWYPKDEYFRWHYKEVFRGPARD